MLAFLFLIAGVQQITAQEGTVVDVIETSNEHTILEDLLETSKFNRVISQEGPYTVIAPTDEAFRQMDVDLDEVRNNQEQAQDIVMEHLFEGEVLANDAENALGIAISKGDIRATNGIIHITDEVIVQDW